MNVSMSVDTQADAPEAVTPHDRLLEALTAIIPNPTLPALYQIITAAALRCARCDNAALYIQEGMLYRCVAVTGPSAPDARVAAALPVLEHWLPLRQMQADPRPVSVPDTRVESFWADLIPSLAGAERIRSWLGLPLVVEGRLIGFLGIGFHHLADMKEEEVRLIGRFAATAAPVLRNATLLAESTANGSRARLRLEIEAGLRGTIDTGAVLREAVEGLGRRMRASICTIFPQSHTGGLGTPVTWWGGNPGLDTRAEVVLQSLVDTCQAQRRTVASTAVGAEPCPEEGIRMNRESLLSCEVNGLVITPISYQGTVFGILLLCNQSPTWNSSDILLIEQSAGDIGGALARADLVMGLHDRLAILEADRLVGTAVLQALRRGLHQNSEIEETALSVIEAIAQVIRFDCAMIADSSAPEEAWEPLATVGTPPLGAIADAIGPRLKASGEIERVDAGILEAGDRVGDALRGARLHSIVAAPVVPVDDEPFGLVLLARRSGNFSEHEAARIAQFTLVFGLALRRRHLASAGLDIALRDERDRLAREIHSFLAQTITSLVMSMDAVTSSVPEDSPLRERLEEIRTMTRSAAGETRRLMWSLRPVAIDLREAHTVVAEEAKRFERREGLRPQVSVVGDARTVAAEIGAVIQRLTQVALENVTRHSGAEHVHILLHYGLYGLSVQIEDDGHGFDPETINVTGGRLGLAGLSERARQVGGTLRIESASGHGTRVHLELPFTAAPPLPRPRPAPELPVAAPAAASAAASLTRIVLIDDHAMVRDGLVRMLSEHEDLQVVRAASTGAEGLRLIGELRPDVVLCDLQLPDIPGTEVIARVRAHFPDIRCLVVTTFDDDDKIYEAIKSGAKGYVLKDATSEELVEAVRAVARNESLLQPVVAHKLVERLGALARQGDMVETLTEREVEVLHALASGLRNKEIAFQLGLSESTIKTHLASIFGKLGVTTRTEAVGRGRELGMIPL
ncbi:MAG TPA: response regulator [Chloroflexota bacterium]|nr:response regulator [Chloroflexota bacterium]